MSKNILLIFLCLWGAFIGAQSIYDIENIIDIRLSFSEPDWAVKLDSLKQLGNDKRLIADAVINGVSYPKVGVRFKGNSSYFNVRKTGSLKLPFNIKVDYKGQKSKLPGGFTSLKLSNVFRDPSFLREVLAYQVVGKYMPAPRANFAKLYVNDQYLGLYNCTESVDKKFLEKYFGNDDGALIKCDPDWHGKAKRGCPKGDKASLMYLGKNAHCYEGLYELKKGAEWKDVITLTHILNKKFDQIEAVLDVDQTLWMLAFDNVTVNLDSYLGRLCHNYYLYRDTLGIYHPIVWDMNLCFGGFRYTGIGKSPLSNEKMQQMSAFIHYKEHNKKRPLVNNLLANKLYRKIYAAHIKTMLETDFANGKFKANAEIIRNLIREHVKNDENKLYTLEGFEQNLTQSAKAGKSNIIGLTELMDARTEYLLNHPLFKKQQPKITNVSAVANKQKVTVSVEVKDASNVYLCYRLNAYHPFKRIPMDAADTDKWTATLDKGNIFQYYIIAENERTVRLSPERASFEFHELKVK